MGKIQRAFKAIYESRRASDHLRQRQLADVLGCEQPAVSHYLNGERPLTDDIIEKWCDFFGISLAELEKWGTTPIEAQLPICPDSNPVHVSFHALVEDLLHNPTASQRERLQRVALKALHAIVALSVEDLPPEGEHDAFGEPGVPLTLVRRRKPSRRS